MYFQQVCMTALAFSAARGGTSLINPHKISIQPLRGQAEIVIEQSNQDANAWFVSLEERHASALYFPSVCTKEDLLNTLIKAWEVHRRQMRPFLSRFVEKEEALPLMDLGLGDRLTDNPGAAQLQEISAMRQTLRDIRDNNTG